MKVLFVSSGNKTTKHGTPNNISILIYNQGEALKRKNVRTEYFGIKGKGIWGYLKNVIKLRKFYTKNNFDIIHAHYSFSGFLCVLAGLGNKTIVSLMGSDLHAQKIYKYLIRAFSKFFWRAIIVKSNKMKTKLNVQNCFVIPNGVNIEIFKPLNKKICVKYTGLNDKTKNIVFAEPTQFIKNFPLAKKATNLIKQYNIELNTISNIVHTNMPYYLNAADVLLLTSYREGSSNIIKEALACNCPVVSTDVGDARKIINGVKGCFVTSYNPEDIADKLLKSLNYSKYNNILGEDRIKALKLDSEHISDKIIDLYTKLSKV